MVRSVMKAFVRPMFAFCILCALSLSLTGCLSHWFIESETRLQVENATEDYSILSLDVVSLDGSVYSSWIDETVLPGERSRVVAGDWVGEFKIRVKYTESADASGDTLVDYRMLDFDGGSMYLRVTASDKGKLEYKFR
ncbi:hypothetical protein [uncultured Fibrobacter sp.]|jgi:hypothetical protein|uniref:hypothetical protein n=1 Tax=uncultured Fibrobacter sp. TaxID=261512 RepID=UPI0025EB4B85|nr:hypothetical protein [uncultured Fibrobacter sp.]